MLLNGGIGISAFGLFGKNMTKRKTRNRSKKPAFNEQKYTNALNTLAEQLILMIKEDYDGLVDRQMASEEYLMSTIGELQEMVSDGLTD